MNVLDFALQMEADGKAYYEKLAAESSSKELQNLFTLLAAAEQVHFDALMARKKEAAFTGVESSLLDEARNIFERLMAMKGEGSFRYDADGYRHAVKAEEQSIGFYDDAANREESPDVKRLLRALADEERIHLNIVENIYDFVESPKTFLAWREFSNLKEF
jgi:rubrerythrin